MNNATNDDNDSHSGLALVQIETQQPKQRKRTTTTAVDEEEEDDFATPSLFVHDIRSQRLSDTYPIRQLISDQSNGIFSSIYQMLAAFFVFQPFIHFLVPGVFNIYSFVPLLGFQKTTQVKLLCEWTCPDGHICQYTEEHTGPHKCVFNHVEGVPILKCKHICDARQCDGRCVLSPGHSGTHKCHFRHYASDIPANRAEQEAFRDDKAIGDYIDELAYSSQEEIKYSHIPESLDTKDENWTNER
jgi:hypothetical protein